MANSELVFQTITKKPSVSYPLLVPNMKGLEKALQISDLKEISIFAAASQSFSQKNINQSIEKSLETFSQVAKLALRNGLKVRGYISCVMGCPYEGKIAPDAVLKVSEALIKMGCYEISLGDTIGVGSPGEFQLLLRSIFKVIDREKVAVHCHDTYGMALANIFAALQEGVRVVDSSVAGLGGCPYAPGASGNVCTEDLIYMLHQSGFETGIDFESLRKVGDWISEHLGRPNLSKVNSALKAKKCQ